MSQGGIVNARPASLARGALLWRGFWLFMLLAHARAIAAAWLTLSTDGPGTDPLRPIALTLAGLFFVLKLIDIRWLRFRTDRRSVAALTLIVALLHVQAIGLAEDGARVPQVLGMATALLFLEPVPRRWEQVYERLFARVYAPSARPAARRPFGLCDTLTTTIDQSPQWLIAHIVTPPRAPPA